MRSLPPPIEQLAPVLLLGPLDREAELPERLVEGRQVPVALGVGEHAVAVEDERAHVQAFPSLPKSRMWYFAISMTAARWAVKIVGGSYSPGCSVMKS